MRQYLQFTELSIIAFLRNPYRYELSHSLTNMIKSAGKQKNTYFLCFCHLKYIHTNKCSSVTHNSKKPLVNMKYIGNCILYTENLVDYVRQHKQCCG